MVNFRRYHQSFNRDIILENILEITIVAVLMYIIRPSLVRLNLFCKQVFLIVITFARNWGNCREKLCFSRKILTQPRRYQIPVLSIAFEVSYLLVTWTGS